MNTSPLTDAPSEKAKGATHSPRILVVDDEEGIRKTLSRVLELTFRDCTIGVAESAEAALEIIEQNPVDILVTDLKLPEMNGLELTQSMKASCPLTRSILMTAFGNDEIESLAGENGCIAYLEKPFDLNELLQHIDQALKPITTIPDRFAISLEDAVQHYAKKLESIVLSVTSKDAAGVLVIRDGIITHAQFDTLEGPEALSAMLELQEPEIGTVPCQLPAYRTLALTWHSFRTAIQNKNPAARVTLFRGHQPLFSHLPEVDSVQRLTPSVHDGFPRPISEMQLERRHDVDIDSLKKPDITRPPYFPDVDANDSDNPYPLRPASSREEKDLPQGANDVSFRDTGRDFEEDELTLQPEPEQGPILRTPSPREQREERVRHYVNTGIEFFRARKFELARKAWLLALRLDGHCSQAQYNLKVLDELESQREKMH